MDLAIRGAVAELAQQILVTDADHSIDSRRLERKTGDAMAREAEPEAQDQPAEHPAARVDGCPHRHTVPIATGSTEYGSLSQAYDD